MHSFILYTFKDEKILRKLAIWKDATLFTSTKATIFNYFFAFNGSHYKWRIYLHLHLALLIIVSMKTIIRRIAPSISVVFANR